MVRSKLFKIKGVVQVMYDYLRSHGAIHDSISEKVDLLNLFHCVRNLNEEEIRGFVKVIEDYYSFSFLRPHMPIVEVVDAIRGK